MKPSKELYLTCIDYTVSNKKFDLHYHDSYDMLVTSPKPTINELPSYYDSVNYISHTDSNKTSIDKLYQIVKKYTLQKKLKLINSFHTKSKSLLDVGCGTGDFLETCALDGWNVVGVEPNIKAQQIAQQKLKPQTKIYNDVFEIQNGQFDVITLWHVLEHVYDLNEYIIALKKLLTPNGVLIIAVPNFKSFDAKYYKNYWAAFDVPRHLWHFSKKAIEQLFLKVDLHVTKIVPMYFDSFYVALLSEKYKTGKSNFFKAFVIGLYSNLKACTNSEYSSLIYVIKSNKNAF